MDQPLEQQHVEIMKLQHAREDVHHQHHQELLLQHVIAKLKQYLNVVLKEHLLQLHVEITKSKTVMLDAHQQILATVTL
jgi:hypothetical protein